MAQPSFDSILNAVMQAESGGRRYDDRGNLLTSSKGAQGEMQVMPRTAKDPGFGVEPAKSSSPDELARVGRDYLKTMLDRYGSLDKALVAYNWGPKNADAWIAKGADPAKLPDETKKYVSRVQSTLSAQPRTTAQAQPEAAPAAAPARGAPSAAPVRVSEARPADLGASYQAALALSFLADEDEKESGGRSYDERQPSAASQWLARETRRVTPESLAMPFRSPFAEPEPVKAASGGFIAVGYEDGGEVDAVASKSTEQPSRPEPFRVPPGQMEARLREFNRLDPATQSLIARDDPRVQFALTPAPASVSAPYTLSTMPGARALYDQTLAGTTTGGYVHPALRMQDRSSLKQIPTQDVVFLRPGREQAQELQSRAHEAEHLLAKRGLGDATAINDKFDELMKDSRARRAFVEKAVSVQPYLEKTYGTKSTYFTPEMLAFQDKRGRGANLLFEQFAELAAIEQATGKDLTKDPELRKTIFKDKKVREVYNSLTGLRQTRLDARDLAPYTPIPEKPEGMMEFIRSKLGFKEGGEAKSEDAPSPEELERASKAAFGIVPSSGKGRKQSRVSEALQSGEAQLAAAKGLTMLPQNVVGAPVDIATLVARPFGYNVEKSVMGSDWLKEKTRAAGLAFQEPEDPTLRAFFTAGDISSNLINPAGATRTAVRGAEKTGEAAKMLAQMAAQDPTVARTVESAIERIAPAAAPMYAVRPKGGHFAARLQRDSSTGEIKLVTDPVGEYVKKRLADTGDDALNNWFERRIGSYLRNEVGSEADPFVQAAQQGRKTHHLFVRNPNEPFEVPPALREMRKAEGFPELGMATNPIAMRLEARSDKAIYPTELQDLPEKLVPSQLKKFLETDPSMRAYSFNYDALNNLELRALRDEMLAMRSQPKEYSKHGVSLNVPEQYRFPDQMLQGLSPDRASELVTSFRFWKQDADGRLASKAVKTSPDITRVELPGGYMWAETPDLADSGKTLELVKDLGCSVGWCTKGEDYALKYGSGQNRLSILMSPKGQAQAQVTVTRKEPTGADFLRYGTDNPELYGFDEESVVHTPEFRKWARSQPENVSITEIQGAYSTDDIRDLPYVTKVQDYVKSLDKKHNLSGVNNLDGIGMTDLAGQVGYMARYGEITYEKQRQVLQEAIRLNGGSKYVNIINKSNPAGPSDYSELSKILEQAVKNVSEQ